MSLKAEINLNLSNIFSRSVTKLTTFFLNQYQQRAIKKIPDGRNLNKKNKNKQKKPQLNIT